MVADFKPVFPASVRCRRIFRWRVIGILAGVIGLSAGLAKENETVHIPEFRPVAVFESVEQAAEAAGMVTTGYAPLSDQEGVQLRDRVMVLLNLWDGRKHRQWILELLATEVNAEEQARPFDSVKQYTSTGHEFTFSGGRSALTMRMIGPLEESDQGKSKALKPKISRRRILISSDYQTLGLQGVPQMALRLRALRQTDPEYQPGQLNFGDKPFSEETIAAGQQQQGVKRITEADERAFIGGIIALKEILITVSRTPGLDDIMMQVVDVPWWSLIRSLGKTHLNIKSLGAYRELKTRNTRLSSDGRVYTWPNKLLINNHEAAVFQLLVVEPKAPLGVMAGVIGMTAGHLDGKGPVLTCQIIATYAADSKSTVE